MPGSKAGDREQYDEHQRRAGQDRQLRRAKPGDVHPAAQFSLVTGILVTAIYVAGILIRRTPKIMGAGIDSWLVFLIWIGSLFVLRAMTA